MDMMTRRRAMMGGIALPEWDYEWNYEDGLPTANGMTKNASGTYSESLDSGGLLLTVGNSSICQYEYSQGVSKGVVEADFWMRNANTTTAGARAMIRLGNSDAALFVYFGYYNSGRRIKLMTDSSFASGQNIGTYSYSKSYNVRLEINDGVGRVLIQNRTDDITVVDMDDIALSTIYYPGISLFGAQNAGNNGVYWHYFKVKSGRL